MPFIGKTPAQGFVNSVTKDDFTPNGTTTAFTLSKTPATVHEIEVYVGNVRQEPTDAYSVSGTTLTMTEAPATGTNFYVMHIGGTTQSSTVVGDGTVTSAKLSGALTTPSNLTVGGVIDATTATFDRASTDGVIVNLQKNNGSIGSIDVDNGDNLTVQGKSDHSGLQFGTNAIFPHKNSANIDATIDLGESTLRWKDIYLSGGVNFSASSNAAGMTSETLDDYEEGDFVPTITTSGGTTTYVVQKGAYTRIGRVCHIMVNLVASNNSNVTLYNLNLPFTAGHVSSGASWYPTIAIGNFYNVNLTGGGTMLGAYTINGQAAARLHSCGNNTNQLAPSCTANTNFEVRFEGSFIIQ